jgi:hypothetical protein
MTERSLARTESLEMDLLLNFESDLFGLRGECGPRDRDVKLMLAAF